MASPTLDPDRLAELLSDLVWQLRIANPADDPNHPVEQDVAQVVALQAALPDLPDLLEDRALLGALDRLVRAEGQDCSLLGTAHGFVIVSTEAYPEVIGAERGLRSTLRALMRAQGAPATVSSGEIAGTETPTETNDAQF